MMKKRAEILVKGLVQGVGFRYFVQRNAEALNIKGYTKNLYTGEVLTVVEAEEFLITELFNKLKLGPSHAHVTGATILWLENKDEFTNFGIRY